MNKVSAKNPSAAQILKYKNKAFWDFPGGPVVKILCSQCRGLGLDSWLGNQIPHAATKIWHSQKRKERKNTASQ